MTPDTRRYVTRGQRVDGEIKHYRPYPPAGGLVSGETNAIHEEDETGLASGKRIHRVERFTNSITTDESVGFRLGAGQRKTYRPQGGGCHART